MIQPTKTAPQLRGRSKVSMLLVHLAAILCVTMWGVSFVSTKVLLDNGLGAVEIYIYRFLIAYLCILGISHKKFMSSTWREEIMFAMCGISAGSIYFIAENTALQYTLTTNVSLLTSLSPLLTALLAGLIYRNERPTSGLLMGSAIAFVGVGCIVFNSSTNVEVRPLGDILSIAAAFSWAFYSLVLRRLSANYDVWFITRKTFFYGLITSLPFLAFEPSLANPLELLSNPQVVGNVMFLALGASLTAYILWSLSVKAMGAVKANNYIYFQSVVTLIASAIMLGEPVTLIGVTGCVLILVGLWLGDWLSRRQSMSANS